MRATQAKFGWSEDRDERKPDARALSLRIQSHLSCSHSKELGQSSRGQDYRHATARSWRLRMSSMAQRQLTISKDADATPSQLRPSQSCTSTQTLHK